MENCKNTYKVRHYLNVITLANHYGLPILSSYFPRLGIFEVSVSWAYLQVQTHFHDI